jgi:PPOX class probable F420-dependent enzyme
MAAIPKAIHGQKYISVATFRKNGAAVYTPVWFAEQDGKLYIMTRSDSGKYKRIRNNPEVRIAPSTLRGKIIGPEFAATAHILPPEDWPRARSFLKQKYWLMKCPSCGASRTFLLNLTRRASLLTADLTAASFTPTPPPCYHHLFVPDVR